MDNPVPGAAASFSCRYLTGSDRWQLRILSWIPHDARAAERPPVLLVPGWTSVVEGWITLLTHWVEVRPLHYIETREKNEARSPHDHRERVEDFTISTHARDLAAIAEELEVGDRGEWFGSSLAATGLLEGFKSGCLRARSAFLLAPNAEFVFPWWMSLLSHLPSWAYPPLIHGLAIPYLRWRAKEEWQRARYARTMLNADVRRLKLSMRANRRYTLWPDLETVSTPCAICVARSDTVHAHDDGLRMARVLANATLVEVASNQVAHEPTIIPIVDGWMSRVRHGEQVQSLADLES